MSKPLVTTLPIDSLIFDPRLQMRAGQRDANGVTSSEHADDIAISVKDRELPDKIRVRVWRVEGLGDLVTDGHHLTEAFRRVGKKMVPAYLFNGTFDEAVLDAAGANIHHGSALKRTAEDKRKAVKAVLKTRPEMSNRDIAAHTGTSDFLVRDIRAEMEQKSEIVKTTTRVGRDGKTHRPAHSGEAVKTNQASSQTPSEKKKAKKKPKGIEKVFDKKGWDARWGWLVRAGDALASVGEKGPHYERLNKALDDANEVLKDWIKHIKDQEKAEKAA